MAELRDYVYDNVIRILKTRSTTSHPCPLNIVFTDNGSNGTTGIKLQDATYSYERYFNEWGYYSQAYKGKYTCEYTKNEDAPRDIYPIIALSMSLNESEPNTFGMCTTAGTFQYDQTDSFLLTNIGYDGHITYECTDGSNFGGGASTNLLEWTQYTENHTQYNTGNGYEVRGAFMATNGMATPQYFNHNQTNWNNEVSLAYYCDDFGDTVEPLTVEVDTNIPIIVFRTEYLSGTTIGDVRDKLIEYNATGNLSLFATEFANGDAILSNNYIEPSVTEGTEQYNMYCDVFSGKWDYDGVTDEHSEFKRYLQVWIAPTLAETNPRVSLIKARQGRHLTARIKTYGEVKQVRYSEDGSSWTTTDTIPYEYLYYKRTEELSPYDSSTPPNRLPLFYDKTHGGNMLLFADEEDADDGSPMKAIDYGDKAQYYTSGNETGTEELNTDMGTTSLESFFQIRYVVDRSDMATISNAIYDTSTSGQSLIESIKQSLQFYGENVIDSIAGLTYFPFDLTTVFRNLGATSSVWFGGVQIPNVSAYRMTNFNGYKDIGSINIIPSFPKGDYRNYSPFTEMYIYLPFCGLQKLEYNKYVDKTLSIRYYFDVTSGQCLACLFADGVLYDYFNGSCGVSLAISATDFSRFAQANIQNYGNLLSTGINTAISPISAMNGGSKVGATNDVVNGLASYEKTMFNVATTSVNQFNTTKGGSTPMINGYLPQYVYVIFSIIETYETPNLTQLEGRATNESGLLSSFSGFLSVDSCNLKCPLATENEKNMIMNYLHSGIYI